MPWLDGSRQLPLILWPGLLVCAIAVWKLEPWLTLFNSVFVFDWDDTLLCSTWLTKQGLKLDSKTSKPAWYVSVLCWFDALQSQKSFESSWSVWVLLSVKLSDDAPRKDRCIYVLTLKVVGWSFQVRFIAFNYCAELNLVLWSTAEKFMPKVVPLLPLCRVLSARSTFEAYYPNNPAEWKVWGNDFQSYYLWPDLFSYVFVLWPDGSFQSRIEIILKSICNAFNSSPSASSHTNLSKHIIDWRQSSWPFCASGNSEETENFCNGPYVCKKCEIHWATDSWSGTVKLMYDTCVLATLYVVGTMCDIFIFHELFTLRLWSLQLLNQLDCICDCMNDLTSHKGNLDLMLTAQVVVWHHTFSKPFIVFTAPMSELVCVPVHVVIRAHSVIPVWSVSFDSYNKVEQIGVHLFHVSAWRILAL